MAACPASRADSPTTGSGQAFVARTVFIAAGVGAFQPRRLQAEGIDALPADQLLYRLRHSIQCQHRWLIILIFMSLP